jgi:hypothetical protein
MADAPRSRLFIIAPAQEVVRHERKRVLTRCRGLKTDPALLPGDIALEIDAAKVGIMPPVSCPRMEFAIPGATAGATSCEPDKRMRAAWR